MDGAVVAGGQLHTEHVVVFCWLFARILAGMANGVGGTSVSAVSVDPGRILQPGDLGTSIENASGVQQSWNHSGAIHLLSAHRVFVRGGRNNREGVFRLLERDRGAGPQARVCQRIGHRFHRCQLRHLGFHGLVR